MRFWQHRSCGYRSNVKLSTPQCTPGEVTISHNSVHIKYDRAREIFVRTYISLTDVSTVPVCDRINAEVAYLTLRNDSSVVPYRGRRKPRHSAQPSGRQKSGTCRSLRVASPIQ